MASQRAQVRRKLNEACSKRQRYRHWQLPGPALGARSLISHALLRARMLPIFLENNRRGAGRVRHARSRRLMVDGARALVASDRSNARSALGDATKDGKLDF
jgi:hypothetical protein